jgi:hypothetical protein
MCQGDIVDDITFVVQDEHGDFGELNAPGMLISHSCDLTDDSTVVFAACRPMSLFKRHKSISDIKNNTFFGAFYLNSVPTHGEIVVDFGILQSLRRSILEARLAQGRTRRISSFTNLGYYFFVAKLTVRFLRPQPLDEIRHDSVPPFTDRLSEVWRDMGSLAKYLILGSR